MEKTFQAKKCIRYVIALVRFVTKRVTLKMEKYALRAQEQAARMESTVNPQVGLVVTLSFSLLYDLAVNTYDRTYVVRQSGGGRLKHVQSNSYDPNCNKYRAFSYKFSHLHD